MIANKFVEKFTTVVVVACLALEAAAIFLGACYK